MLELKPVDTVDQTLAEVIFWCLKVVQRFLICYLWTSVEFQRFLTFVGSSKAAQIATCTFFKENHLTKMKKKNSYCIQVDFKIEENTSGFGPFESYLCLVCQGSPPQSSLGESGREVFFVFWLKTWWLDLKKNWTNYTHF